MQRPSFSMSLIVASAICTGIFAIVLSASDLLPTSLFSRTAGAAAADGSASDAVRKSPLVVQTPSASPSNRWGADYFPNVLVTNQHGQKLRFYDDVLKGKIVVISFIYTSCTDLCPLTTARMAQLEDKLGGAVGRDLYFISMSVDPQNDTPDKLKAFSDAFDAGPGWLFLTGNPDEVKMINYKLGDRSQGNLSEHRNEIVIGNDATGEWQRDSLFGDLDRLVMTIRAMDPQWRNDIHIPGTDQVANSSFILSDQPGQALFKKICAPCHTVGVGDRVGPDLRDVSARRDRAWLRAFLRDPKKMHTAKDPIAIELAARFPGVRMPALGIGDSDAADLINYLDTESARMTDSLAGSAPSSAHHHHHH